MYIYTLKPESVDWIRTYLSLNSPTYSKGNACHSFIIEDKNFYIIREMFYYLKEDKLHTILHYRDKNQYRPVFDVMQHCIIEEYDTRGGDDFPYYPQYILSE
jgi:hypothetical protein